MYSVTAAPIKNVAMEGELMFVRACHEIRKLHLKQTDVRTSTFILHEQENVVTVRLPHRPDIPSPKLLRSGVHKFSKKSRSHVKILGSRMVTRSKFHT